MLIKLGACLLTLHSRSHILLLSLLVFVSRTSCSTQQLDSSNIQGLLASNELVFINFYADWCRFSQMLKPIFEEAAVNVAKEHPPGKVLFARVDCDNQDAIAREYSVSKYPTLKLIRHGKVVKREYRGQRSAEAFQEYIREQLRATVTIVNKLEELDAIDKKKRTIIGYFDNSASPDYASYQTVSSELRDECSFYAAIGEISAPQRIGGMNKVVFKSEDEEHELQYSGPISDTRMLNQWSLDKCLPLVREITFTNAEELTEEGLPFLILFRKQDDSDILRRFKNVVAKDLTKYRAQINFLVADGNKFSHPLQHLGKSMNDLPVIAIDSFRHMYIFPKDVKAELETPGLLSTFIDDLNSGKLHREFHNGPDPDQPQVAASPSDTDQGHVPNSPEPKKVDPKSTSPPESTFAKLAPSETRYSFSRQNDEL